MKFVGGLGLPLPMNPKVTLPPLARMVPFQFAAGLLAVMTVPFWLKLAFQPLLNRSPDVNVHISVYPEIGVVDRLNIVMSAWKPLSHCVTIAYEI
jgi:hypothetical protein